MWPFDRKYSLADSGIFQDFTDWHCHILPGVDDGVRMMGEALDILALYEKLGVKTVWLTPHVMEEMPNTTARLKARFEELQAAYKGSVQLHLAAEYMLDDLFCQRLNAGDLLPLGERGDRLLVEISCYGSPMNLENILKRIQSAGYHPVLAHPERYVYMDDADYGTLKERGVLFQLNLPSLAGLYGETVRNKTENLLTSGRFDLWGTDCHYFHMAYHMCSRKLCKSMSRILSQRKNRFI